MNVVKLLEPFAVTREQEVHREALQTYGEKVVVRQAWTINDFLKGDVTRCSTCHAGADASEQAMVREVYKQAGESYCNDCFGVGFTGGFQPILYVSWALITDQMEDWHMTKTGRYTPANPMAQFIWTPHLQEFDLVCRFEYWTGDVPSNELERDVLREVQPVTLRTGPGAPRSTIPGREVAGVTETLIVGQVCQIENLPQKHTLYDVDMDPTP